MINLDDKITEHFTWREVVFSETAIRLGIDNTPSDELFPNIKRQAQFMEQVRFVLGARPIFISSWYRSPMVNQSLGGAANSAHLKALACDFQCPSLGTPLVVARYLAASPQIDFDQILHEFGRWVHIGLNEGNRHQLLTAMKQNGKTVYLNGLVEVA